MRGSCWTKRVSVCIYFQFILDLQEPVRKKRPAKAKRKKQQHTQQIPTSLPATATTSGDTDPLQPTNPSQLPAPAEGVDSSTTVGASSTAVEKPAATACAAPQLEPLVNVWRDLNYRCLRCLHVWNLPQTDEAVVALVSVPINHR